MVCALRGARFLDTTRTVSDFFRKKISCKYGELLIE